MFASADAFARTDFGGAALARTVSRTALLFVGLVLASLLAVPGTVAAAEDPRFETYVDAETVPPGRTTQVRVTFLNDAAAADDRVEAAHHVQATMRDGETPFSVTSGTRLLGTLRDGRPATATFGVDVPTTVESGTYRVPVDLTYEYEGDERETTTVYVTLRVTDRAVFEVVGTTDATRVGATGPVTVTVENVGSEVARDARVELASPVPALSVSGSPSTNRFVGTVEPGERQTVTVDLTASSRAEARPYALTATVVYDDAEGARRRSRPLTANVTPAPPGRFEVTTAGSNLHAGEEGTMRIAVTNRGATTVDEGVLRLVGEYGGVHPERREAVVGSLAPGERATAVIPVDVSDDVDPAPRRFEFVLSYDERDGDRTKSITYGTTVPIGGERERFAVTVANAAVTAGSTGTVRVAVTNVGERRLTAIDAKAYTDAPYTVTDDASFIGSLAPGETTTIRFGVSMPGGAAGKRYPLSLDFQYDTPDGDSHLSDTYEVPVSVTPATGLETTTIAAGGALAFGGVLLVGYWYSRD